MKSTKQQLIELLETLNENEIVYIFTFIKKIFGSR